MRRERWMVPALAAVPALWLSGAPARADAVVDEAIRIINRRQITHPDPASLPHDSPVALLAGLRRIDAAAQWWPPTLAVANTEWTGNDVVGIGASVIDDGSRILLVPLSHGPLARQGLSQPARLLTVAGTPVRQPDLELVERILAERSRDPIDISVQPLTGGPPSTLSVARGRYQAVTAERIDVGGVPVLRIHRFVTAVTLPQVRQALRNVRAGQPVVVDLRYSAGGDLFEALNTASLFVKPGLKLATMENADGRRTVLTSVDSGDLVQGPVTVLVSKGTISASETFAAALQAHAKAKLVGSTTFGKCLAQSTYRLTDGSILVFSTERILTAADWYCDRHGLTPDVPLSSAETDDTDAVVGKYVR
jgi:carboxyl-terminal processing protease